MTRFIANLEHMAASFLRAAVATVGATQGFNLWDARGWAGCHQGVDAGGNLFAPLGAMGDYFGNRGKVTAVDYGRFNVTGREEDRFVFKVPSLRNIARTAPYFHDGSALRLEGAVRTMATYQLGRDLPEVDVEEIAKFLRTLTGEYGGKPL